MPARSVAWAMLFGAGLLEIVWAVALKYSDGFARLWPSAVGIAAATASFFLLTAAMRTLPLGTAYTVWVGIGAAGAAIVGIVAFAESAAPLRLACVALIVIGAIGLKVSES